MGRLFLCKLLGEVIFILFKTLVSTFAISIAIASPTANSQTDTFRDCSLKKGKKYKVCKYENYIDRLDKKCKSHTVINCIRYAAAEYNQSYSQAKGVAFRESTLNRYASNGSHFGLYQFDWDTWQGSPYDDNGSVYSARFNSLAAMWYWKKGETSRWAQTY